MANKYSKDLQNLAPTSVEPHIYDSHKAFHLVKSKSFIVELLHLFCTKEQIKKEIHKELWVDSHCAMQYVCVRIRVVSSTIVIT